MDKFLGRLTFGFLLGQVAPGFVLVTSFWLLGTPDFGNLLPEPTPGEKPSPPWILLLVSGSLIGVVLDQLNWAAGGWLKKMERTRKLMLDRTNDMPSIIVILLGPIGIALPVISALLFSKVKDLSVTEFLPKIDPNRFAQWEWFQDFYLYSAEFCSNSALVATILFAPLMFAGKPWSWTLGVWLIAGTLKLLEMRAFNTLWEAEGDLAKASNTS